MTGDPTKEQQDANTYSAKAEFIFSAKKEEMRPDQLLLDGPSTDDSFAGITIEQLQSMPPPPRISAAYRPDMLVDCSSSQTPDLRLSEEFDLESTRDGT